MRNEKEPALTLDTLRTQLKAMANLDLSEEAAGMHELLIGLVAVMNSLQPPAEVFPAVTFRPVQE